MNQKVQFMLIEQELDEIESLIKNQKFTDAESRFNAIVAEIEEYSDSDKPDIAHSFARIYRLLGLCFSGADKHDLACENLELSMSFIEKINDMTRSHLIFSTNTAFDYANELCCVNNFSKALRILDGGVEAAEKLVFADDYGIILKLRFKRAEVLHELGYQKQALSDINLVIKKLKKLYRHENDKLVYLAIARCVKAEIIEAYSPFPVCCLPQIALAVLDCRIINSEKNCKTQEVIPYAMDMIGDRLFEFMVSGKISRQYNDAIEYANNDTENGNLISLIPLSVPDEYFLFCECEQYRENKPERSFLTFFYYYKIFKYLSFVLREEKLSKSRLTHFRRTAESVLQSLRISSTSSVTSKVMCARLYVLLADYCRESKKYRKALKNLDSALKIYSSLLSSCEEINKEKAIYAFFFIQERRVLLCELMHKEKEAAGILSYTADFCNDIDADIPLVLLTKLMTTMYTRSALKYDEIGDFLNSEKRYTDAINVFNAYKANGDFDSDADRELIESIIDTSSLAYFRRGTTRTRLESRNYSASLRDYEECAKLLSELSDVNDSKERLSVVYRSISEIYEAFGELETAKKYYHRHIELLQKNT